jgi:hypothetical protein
LVGKNVAYLGDKTDSWLVAAHMCGWAAVLGLAVLILAAVRFWKAPGLGWWARVHPTLLVLASGIFLGFAWWSHLLSPSIKF